MSKLSKLLQVTREEKEAILNHYHVTEAQFDEYVELIKEWVAKNPHLPQEHDINKYKVSLLNSKLSLERAKQSLEGYYRVRALYADFFSKLLPNTEDFFNSKKYGCALVMPKLLPNLCRITFFKFTDLNGEAEDALIYYIMTLMIAELRISNDYFLSNVLLIDLADYNLKTMLKFSPSIQSKLLNILHSVNLRIKEVHILNAPHILDRVLTVLKPLLPPKLFQKVIVHPNYESLHEFIQKAYLPSNYGGHEKSIEELCDEWCTELKIWEPFFRELLKVKSSEKLKHVSSEKEIFGMGSEGSFKKLAID